MIFLLDFGTVLTVWYIQFLILCFYLNFITMEFFMTEILLLQDDINGISTTCGQNVVVNGNTAEWCCVDSGGRLFVEQPLTQHNELVLKLTESGHADVGILTVNPIFLSDVTHVGRLNELTVIQNAKIHNQTGIIQLKRSQNGDKIVLRSGGQNQYFEVNKSDDIWITVNIIYGTLKVQIGKYLLKVASERGSE